MTEWKEYKLGEITTEIGDGIHGTPNYSKTGDYYFINGNNIVNGKVVVKSDTKKVDSEQFQKYRKPLSDRTILLSINGTIGSVGYYNNEKCILGKSACYLNIKDTVDKHFVYYVFLTDDFQNHLQNIATGTTIQNVPLKGLRESIISLPPLDEQRRISAILSSLDDKIDLLHRENATMEQMAETLFRQWFVVEAKEEWEEGKLTDYIKLIGGGTPKTTEESYWNGNVCWLSGGDIANNHKGFVSDSEKHISEIGLNNSAAKLLPENALVVSARGTVGKYCLLSKPMAFSQSNYGILPMFEDCYFFTYLLVAYHIDELQSAAYGSVFDTITTKTFEGVSVLLPKETGYIVEFEKMIEPYFSKMKYNNKQIQTLIQTRDGLLPRLMGRELKV